jgi:hypothetical protein
MLEECNYDVNEATTRLIESELRSRSFWLITNLVHLPLTGPQILLQPQVLTLKSSVKRTSVRRWVVAHRVAL